MPMWAGVAIVLAAGLMVMFIVTSGWGSDQTTKTPTKTPGHYYRAIQWSGHLSVFSQFVATGIITTGLVVGVFGTCWKSST